MSDILSDDINALFWSEKRAAQVSAWHGHVSFGHWLTQVLHPGVVVELGSHNGVSFASFCNAVNLSQISARCFAIDTWGGDDHAGYYGEEVYRDFEQFIGANYSSFATLLRCYFDEAVAQFTDGSIDLLHIDGLHTYQAVRHDFETWYPKLSERAVVLFHDTEVHHLDFGVWKLWEELSAQYPSFNFTHSAGLGVLAVGASLTPAVAALCARNSGAEAEAVRDRFARASYSAHRHGLQEHNQTVQSMLDAIQGGRLNIALNRPAFQSSALAGGGATPGGGVNGAKTGKFGFHTALEANPWWMVDLGAPQAFEEVVIYNRLDSGCQQRANALSLLVSYDGETWRELYSHNGSTFGGIDGFPLRVRSDVGDARFVRIKLRDMQCLHLDEVEIYQRPAEAS